MCALEAPSIVGGLFWEGFGNKFHLQKLVKNWLRYKHSGFHFFYNDSLISSKNEPR